MTVDFMYRIVQYAVNKNQQGYVDPDEFNDVIEQAQLSYVNYLIGQYNQYQNGRPVSRVSFSQNSNVRQSLMPAIYGYVLNVNAYGFAPYPGDFQKVDGLTDIYNMKAVRWANRDNYTEYYHSKIDPYPTNPFYTLENNGFTFYPSNIGQVLLNYVRKPSSIYWAYTIVNNLPVQNVAASINPIWYDIDCLEIIARALRIIGVNLQAADVNQYANEIKQMGQ